MRFDYNNPPHTFYPAVTDWHVYDEHERISIPLLVRRANELQRQVQELREQLEAQKERGYVAISN